MPIEFVHAFLATSADLYRDGRFAVLGGGFDAIEVSSLPATIPLLSVVARVRVPPVESDRPHEVRVIVYRPDGEPIRENVNLINPIDHPGPRIGPLERGFTTNIVINLYNLELNVSGVYRVEFREGDARFGELAIPVADSAGIQGS